MRKTRLTFLGIGAQKAGTTWLYHQLSNHSEIWMPPVKEIHFFDRSLHYPTPNRLATSSLLFRILGSKPWQRSRIRSDIRIIARHIKAGNYHQAVWWSKWAFGYYNDSWYGKLFSQARSYKACGEITPSYSILENEDVARIQALNSDIKIIFMIRNPIERAWSAIRFNVDRGFTKISLDSDDEIISALKEPGMVSRGDYELTIDTFLKYFDSSQILVCFYDAIKCDPSGLMNGITTFLDVAPFKETAIDSETLVNPSPARKMSSEVRDYLVETYTPMTIRIAKTFGSYAKIWAGIEGPFETNSQRTRTAYRLPPTVHP